MKNLKKLLLIIVFVLIIFILSFFIFEKAVSVSAQYQTGMDYRAGEVLVKFKNDAQIYKIKFDDTEDLNQIINLYKNSEFVEAVEPNLIYQLSFTPNDEKYFQEWHLEQIQAPAAWEASTGWDKVTIAVIDTGVDINHPDLKDNIWVNKDEVAGDKIDNDKNGYIDDINGWDFISNKADPSPKLDYSLDSLDKDKGGLNHGTVIAGIIAARGNNKEGIAGVTWQSKIMSLRILDSKGYGNLDDLIDAINYAIAKEVDVINFSFVGHQGSKLLDQALLQAYNAGIVIVAAAGNELANGQSLDFDQTLIYPVCSNYDLAENIIIGVGATDTLDQVAKFSGHGTRCLDINAPGYSIFSTQFYKPEWGLDSYYGGRWTGTSLSTPMVSGAAALLKSLNNNLSNKEVIRDILEGADSIDDVNPSLKGKLGYGRLNLKNSAELALGSKVFLKGNKNIIITPITNSNSEIKILDLNFDEIKTFKTYPYRFAGGINIAVADFGKDGQYEILTGPGRGGGPQILMFDNKTVLRSQFFAYESSFAGGVSIDVGDVNGDGEEEIITGPGPGRKSEIKIFNKQGALLSSFNAYDEKFLGGVNVAAGDIDGDKLDEIIVGVSSGNPHIVAYSWQGRLKANFFAYSMLYQAGVLVASADINGDGVKEIVTGTNKGGGPHVRVFDRWGKIKLEFFDTYNEFRGGVYVAAGDIDGDGRDEIITGSGVGKVPSISFYESDGTLISENQVWEADKKYGVRVRLIK